jgi:hypothetical protein
MLLALPAKIRLGWTGLHETNVLAYFKHLQISDIKSFIALSLAVALDEFLEKIEIKKILMG